MLTLACQQTPYLSFRRSWVVNAAINIVGAPMICAVGFRSAGTIDGIIGVDTRHPVHFDSSWISRAGKVFQEHISEL